MSISGISGSGFIGGSLLGTSNALPAMQLLGSGATGGTSSAQGAAGATSAMNKMMKDMVGLMIIDSFLEAKGAHPSQGIGAALNMYSAKPAADGATSVQKVVQAGIALSTMMAIG